MKKSELRQLIREEVRNALKEVSKPKYIDFGPFKKVEYAGPGRKDGEMIIRLIVSDKNLANKMSQYLTSIGIENEVLKSKETNDSLIDISTNYLSKLDSKREEVREAINNENTKLNLKKNGIYILDGGLNKRGEWDEKSLKKAKVLYYTTDFRDPKLKNFQEDGMVKVEITKDGDIDVVQY